MTICDIFDALVASDRPYKRAMKPDIAHRILEDEARKGLLDDLAVKVFIEAKVHKNIEGKEYPRATQMGDLTFHHHVCDFDLHRDLDDDAGLR
jgi:HD-GYP domain-containing protein (c-di-GMP phosphodiesterase class II)